MFGLIFGILSILVLPLLLIPGIILAVLSGVLVLAAGLVHSCGGFPIGIAIGLLLYRMIRRSNMEKKAGIREEAREEVREEAHAGESEVLAEPTMSRNNGTGCSY